VLLEAGRPAARFVVEDVEHGLVGYQNRSGLRAPAASDGGDLLLREASAFFAGGGTLRQTLHRLVKRLMAEGIPHALKVWSAGRSQPLSVFPARTWPKRASLGAKERVVCRFW